MKATTICGGGKIRGESAFSLVEILVMMGIVAVLAAVAVPVSKSMADKAKAVREMAGARRTVAAWLTYAGDSNGKVLVGYASADCEEVLGAKNGAGEPIKNIVARRYVYRLAPYLNFELRGSLLVNDQENLRDEYTISVQPSLGINVNFLGGDYGTGSEVNPGLYPEAVVTHLSRLIAPSRMLVFASARITDASFGEREGYNALKSPNVFSREWPKNFDPAQPYYICGNIHPRYEGRAVCAMADGHVELLDYEQLLDMRRWSNLAAIADDPNWKLPTL